MKPIGVIANPASGRDIRRLISSADTAPISHSKGVIALDGEREHVLTGEPMQVRYRASGPRVVDLERTLEEAACAGMMAAQSQSAR